MFYHLNLQVHQLFERIITPLVWIVDQCNIMIHHVYSMRVIRSYVMLQFIPVN